MPPNSPIGAFTQCHSNDLAITLTDQWSSG